MTNEVSALVLKDNYDQTGALTLAQSSAPADLDSHERLIQRLEAGGKISRRVEGLPTTAEFASLREAGQGLTRPELAKLIAYAKIDLFDALMATRTPDDPTFAEPLRHYFPRQLWKFETQMASHRLRREIIATTLADDVVNRCGPSFVDRVREVSRAEPVVVACAFEAARRIFEIESFVARINALDNKVPAGAQVVLHQTLAVALRRLTTYLARNAGLDRESPPSILDVVAHYKDAVAAQREGAWEDLSDVERARVGARQAWLMELGAPEDLARETAMLAPQTTALDVADLARGTKWPVKRAAQLHCIVGAEFGLDALRDAAGGLTLHQHWDRLVVRRAAEDFATIQLKLAEAAAAAIGRPPKDAEPAWTADAAKGWIEALGLPAQRARTAYQELHAQGPWTFAKLMLISAEFNALAAAVRWSST
jgi:glutamate dehydrogenase